MITCVPRTLNRVSLLGSSMVRMAVIVIVPEGVIGSGGTLISMIGLIAWGTPEGSIGAPRSPAVMVFVTTWVVGVWRVSDDRARRSDVRRIHVLMTMVAMSRGGQGVCERQNGVCAASPLSH